MEANLRILQSFKKINEKINDNEEKQKEINKKIDDFLKDISKEIKEIDNENQDLKKELSETIEKVKQEKPKDGKDGKDGRDGKDGYTPVKGKDYFDGKDGVDGLDGKNGVDGKNGKDGKDGQDGVDGIGIYDIEINDKGELIITLTNGKKINCGVVKGKDGVGYAGVSVTNAKIVNGELIITLSTGREINAGKVAIEGTNTDLTGYATEKWVGDNYYNKKEVDAKLEDLPTGGTELTGGDNTVIEDNAINVYTNTGYKVIDKDIQLQSIIDSETNGTNKIVYAKDKEVMFIIDGTNKMRKSENGIYFEVITLPRVCKDAIYMNEFDRLMCVSNDGYFFYSDDFGLTWNEKQSNQANGVDYLFRQATNTRSFKTVSINGKIITDFSEGFSTNSQTKSSIAPMFMTNLNSSQTIWCNNTGTFKYGAGSNEGAFASLSGVTVNMLKTVNDKPIVGLKNNNKIYIIKATNLITGNEWIEYKLPDVCTINDIIFNPNDETYYIFTDIKTYYKTKNFVKYDDVDKNGLRGLQGHFTLRGIQTTTSNHNELLLAPTRTTLENKAQEWDRGLNKSLWVGKGFDLDENGKINVKVSKPLNIFGDNSIGLPITSISLDFLAENLQPLLLFLSKPIEHISPYDIETWFWENWNGTAGEVFPVRFTEDGTFYDCLSYENEYVVERGELGYLYVDAMGYSALYVYREKMGDFLN